MKGIKNQGQELAPGQAELTPLSRHGQFCEFMQIIQTDSDAFVLLESIMCSFLY